MNDVIRPRLHPGQLAAHVLAGAWRRNPPPLAITQDELARATPGLISCGAAALAWNRLAESHAKAFPEAQRLRDIYRHLALEAAIKESSIGAIARLFADAGMEPMIFKGRAVAQHYTATHLRPFGDIDLCVPPNRHADAAELLSRHANPELQSPKYSRTHERGQFMVPVAATDRICQIDLHTDLDEFQMPPVATVYARSRRLTVDGQPVRVPTGEDHLRLVAMHFLAHGGWRPVWLADVAALLETLPADVDWNICFGEDPCVAQWIASVFELAHVLLGANVERVPPAHRIDHIPDWLVRTVLREWQTPHPGRFSSRPLSDCAREPAIIAEELRKRWPNGVIAMIKLHRSFQRRSPLPSQFTWFAKLVTAKVAKTAANLVAR